MDAPDAGIPKEVVDSARCIAVIPDMVKGGFVFGARHGLGVATVMPRMDGASRLFSPLRMEAGAFKSELKVLT